jgi:serine/threonine-protein kinase HipA
MTAHINTLRVLMAGRSVGRLSAGTAGDIYFQYDSDWLAEGFDLSPVTMPFNALPAVGHREPFHGLHGVFNDSLPDGWGLLLMDRALKSRLGWDPFEVSPLDRLAYIGRRGMGALEYQPELQGAGTDHAIDIAELAAASERLLKGDSAQVIADLYLQGGSPGGARPKITVARNHVTGECLSGFASLPPGYEHWLVKFQGENDPRDSGRLEMAYADMAVAAGLRFPHTELIELSVPSSNSRSSRQAFFAVRRFDRHADEKRHVLSLSGYLHADHRSPSLDYQTVLAATQRLTRDVGELREAFRLMVFNILAHNKDDHAKNFAFIGTPAGWSVSPAFDLNFSPGPGNEHTSSVAGKGNPDLKDVLNLARSFRLDAAAEIVDEVRAAVSRWPQIASEWDVSAGSVRSIGTALAAIDKRFQ